MGFAQRRKERKGVAAVAFASFAPLREHKKKSSRGGAEPRSLRRYRPTISITDPALNIGRTRRISSGAIATQPSVAPGTPSRSTHW